MTADEPGICLAMGQRPRTSGFPPEDLDGLAMTDWDRVCAVNVRGLVHVTGEVMVIDGGYSSTT